MNEPLGCPHQDRCPGCPLSGLDYPRQLEAKRARVVRALEGFSGPAAAGVEAARGATPVLAYRQRAKLVAGGPRLGLYARGSHELVDIPGCRVLDPKISAVAAALRREAPFRVPVLAVDLRRVDEGVLVTLVIDESAPKEALEAEVARVSPRLPEVVGVAVSLRPRRSPQLLGRPPRVLFGPERFRRSLGADTFAYVGHGAFAQAHPSQERALLDAVEAVCREAAGRREVLELFGGSGALSIRLAGAGFQVLTVESFAPAVAQLRDAASEQRLAVEVAADDAERAARRLVEEGRRFDAVVVNPPRRGLTPELRRSLAALAPARVAYVSCCPETLARDLAHLGWLGLSALAVLPHDMMPWTEQVETLAVLAPAATPPPVTVLHEDASLIAVAKPPHAPTTPQGEHPTSLLDRVRRTAGAPEAVPVHRLDLGTSGVCLFARTAGEAATLARALAEGEKEYLVLARGVTRRKGTIARPLRDQGKSVVARTRFRRLEVVGGHSLLRVLPEHGRKHQIRRHLASLGHPVLGDERYGDAASNEYFFKRHGLDRAFIHCERITLPEAIHGATLRAPLAADLALVLESLRRAASARDPDVE